MSSQVNFFADSNDREVIHNWLQVHFPDLHVIPMDRRTSDQLVPVPFDSGRKRILESKVLLLPDPVKTLKLEESKAGIYVLLPRSNPVIEYLPSAARGADCLKSGRVYWAYSGRMKNIMKSSIEDLFKWMREHSLQISSDNRFRIFGSAQATAKQLDYGFNIVEPNPFRIDEARLNASR